ncbi:hydroxyacid dehydrogenase [Patescibacteria group bacterium]|nr:hydroxyacid dehydrogenase [Patescibacteria group bacterium]
MSDTKKIAIFEAEKWEQDYLKEQLEKAGGFDCLYATDDYLKEDDVSKIKDIEILVVFIHSQVTAEIIEKLPNLKLITTRSTGYDHIDVKACEEKGIVVCNVPFYGENTVAEHAFALILAISRKIVESYERIRDLDYDLSGLRGFDLKGKTLGIVGMGHIGQNVARIARGFGMEVVASDPHENAELAEEIGFTYLPLVEVLANSDIVTLHAPLIEATHHMINKDTIKEIKKGAYIINTARGGLIETDALVQALKDELIAGAGLDVIEEEEFIREGRKMLMSPDEAKHDLKTILQGHFLIEDPRVIVTPHNAFNSIEALTRILNTTIENISGFVSEKPENVVQVKK